MRFGCEPGDGSIHIILENGEKLPPQWNVPGVSVMEEVAPICGGTQYRMIKQEDEILATT